MAVTHSTPTLQKAHNCLTRALRHAEGRDLVRRNVSALVDTPRGREGRPSQALTLEQAAVLLEVGEDSRLHAYIVLCLLTGVLSEEARALTWDHLDLDVTTISVWRGSCNRSMWLTVARHLVSRLKSNAAFSSLWPHGGR
jgi:integrase